MTFVKRELEISFQLVGGRTFADTSSNTSTISGVRASAKITNAGGALVGALDLEVYGLTKSTMNDLSTLGMIITQIPRNLILIKAMDLGGTPTTVFYGNIMNAYADFEGAPDVPFRITGQSLGANAVIPVAPTSFSGSVDVASALSGLASQMGLTFENNGVDVKLSNSYLCGSAKDQAVNIIRHANIEWNGGENGILAIWPKNGARSSDNFTLNPQTGMVGYPTYTQDGLMVRTVFNPAIKFGSMIQVQSSLGAQASQMIKVIGLDHDLETQVPGGNWYSTIKGYNPSNPQPPPLSMTK